MVDVHGGPNSIKDRGIEMRDERMLKHLPLLTSEMVGKAWNLKMGIFFPSFSLSFKLGIIVLILQSWKEPKMVPYTP